MIQYIYMEENIVSKFIVTFTPYFMKSVIRDLVGVDKKIQIEKTITHDKLLILSNFQESDFLQKLKLKGSAFIKHICPANLVSKITSEFSNDKEIILDSIKNNGINIENGERFSVQARVFNGGTSDKPLDYKSKDVEICVGEYFEKLGGIPTFSDKSIMNNEDVRVISIFINGVNLYIGQSNSSLNFNFNCDDHRVASRSGGCEISRAENKLKEALAKYNLHLDGQGKSSRLWCCSRWLDKSFGGLWL